MVISPIIIVMIIYKLIAYTNNNEDYDYTWDYSVKNTSGKSKNRNSIDGKHREMHVFGFGDSDKKNISDLLKANVEWTAVVPFIYQKNEQSKQISVPNKIGHWTKKDSSFIEIMDQFHNSGLRVMLKPHLWLSDGSRSNINLSSKKEWNAWFVSYRQNMIHYAKLAEQSNVELLCIGTELRTSIKQQPKAWDSLIEEIKEVYSGKLTYAANWDEENELLAFWKKLDYIGIQAYFPLTENKNTDLETIKKGWNQHIIKLEAMSKKYNRPILFTEVGYKSETSATVDPWEWNSLFRKLIRKKSNRTQQLAYEALFQSVWGKDWFAGIYVRQWSFRSQKENAPKNLDFSPRFKPAENTIAKWFDK